MSKVIRININISLAFFKLSEILPLKSEKVSKVHWSHILDLCDYNLFQRWTGIGMPTSVNSVECLPGHMPGTV